MTEYRVETDHDEAFADTRDAAMLAARTLIEDAVEATDARVFLRDRLVAWVHADGKIVCLQGAR